MTQDDFSGTDSLISYSTISGNSANGVIGGVSITSYQEGVDIEESTISGNSAAASVGGLYIAASRISIANSTIAFNTAANSAYGSAGLTVDGIRPTGNSFTLDSTIIAGNTVGIANAPFDFTVSMTSNSVPLTGARNLIYATDADIPADTLVGKCPLLARLANNGGPTQTHALMGHSPAIDNGSNPNGDAYDQRGGPFVRMSGPPGLPYPSADIGAYDVDQADEIFNVGFEGCS